MPEQPGVDEDTGQPVPDGPVDEQGGHRGVDPARQRAQHVAVADPGPDRRLLLLDDRDAGPVGPAAGRLVQEVPEQVHAPLGVGDIGVELDPVQAPLGVLERGHRGGVGAGHDP